MTTSLNPIAASSRATLHRAADPQPRPALAGPGRSPGSSSAPVGARPQSTAHARPAATQSPAPDPWARLHAPFGTAERARVARQVERLLPHEDAWSAGQQRAELENALKQSDIACFDITQTSRTAANESSGPQFSASIHPTQANVESFVDQLYQAGTGFVANLARRDEYGLKDPAYYDTGGEAVEIGGYLVTGRQVGRPVSLGMNTPAEGETSQPIMLRFYEATIVPKNDADNPAAVHTLRAFEVDQLTDGTAFEAGQLTRLAMHLLRNGPSSIHVHCHGGFDRTGMTVVLSQFVQRLLEGEQMQHPLAVLRELIDNFRASRGEPTAIQGGLQLAALIGECSRLAAMPHRELKALFDATPAFGLTPSATGPSRARPRW
jgi:hypothetical protein